MMVLILTFQFPYLVMSVLMNVQTMELLAVTKMKLNIITTHTTPIIVPLNKCATTIINREYGLQ